MTFLSDTGIPSDRYFESTQVNAHRASQNLIKLKFFRAPNATYLAEHTMLRRTHHPISHLSTGANFDAVSPPLLPPLR